MENKKNYHTIIFEKIYKQFSNGIFRYIYFKVSDFELAQDLTVNSFIRYWKILVKGEEIDNDRALLYKIAKGKIIDHYRKKGNNKHISLEKIDERLLGKIDPTEDIVSRKQELEQIYLQIKKIKKDFQDVILLHYVEDLTIKEMAFILHKKENAVRVLLHRALKSLKEKL